MKEKKPLQVWKSFDGEWTWEFLGKPKGKPPFTRVFCRVKTPFTSERGDMGDVYLKDIMKQARRVDITKLDVDGKECCGNCPPTGSDCPYGNVDRKDWLS